MRVLLVEDSAPTIEALRVRMENRIPNLRLEVAESLDQVAPILERSTIDAAIVDLRIPSAIGKGDPSVDFGKAAEVQIRVRQPGALRIFLTASEAREVVQALSSGKSDDFFVSGVEFGLADYVIKESVKNLDECVDKIDAHWRRLCELDQIELVGGDHLDEDERRAVALTVRVAGGCSGKILRTSGKSGARTSLVECRDASGSVISNAFCKSGPSVMIDREIAGHQLAVYQLPTTAFPTLDRTLDVGVGAGKALVFTKAPSSTTFFDVVRSDPEAAGAVAARLPSVFEGWASKGERNAHSVQALIDGVLSPATRKEFSGLLSALDLTEISSEEVELIECCQHGDLHGENMFVLASNEPFLIDFAHTRPQPGPVDPVSLELSLIFHDSSPFHNTVSVADCSAWFTGTPYSPTAGACRRWAFNLDHTQADYALSSLLYALWILRHAETPQLAIAIAQSALDVLRGDSSMAGWA